MYVCMCACPQVCMYVMSRCLTMPARSASNDERQGQRLHPRGGQGSQSCEVRNRILGMRWARQCYCCYYTATATTTTTTTPTTATTTTTTTTTSSDGASLPGFPDPEAETCKRMLQLGGNPPVSKLVSLGFYQALKSQLG